MFRTRMGAVMLCAAAMLAPVSATSYSPRADSEFVAALGVAIAAQGNQALRDIRREALASLRALKPAPLDTLIHEVKREPEPIEIVQYAL